MRFLVVDDEFTSLILLKGILEKYGECEAATHGQQAFNMFQDAHQKKKPYHLITMDMMMPDIKGMEIVEKIRLWEKINEIKKDEKVKILMVTAL